MIGSRRALRGGPHRPPEAPAGLYGRLARAFLALTRRRRRIRPTPEGWVFLAAALAVALAALNTGNNLLYLVFATQLSMIALSGVLSELSIQRLRPRRRLRGRIFANRPAAGTWTVHNPRSRLPGLAVAVSEAPSRAAELSESGSAQVAVLPPGASEQLPATWRFRQRGVHRLPAVRVSTTWPFGIFRKFYDLAAPMEVLVHPDPRAGGRLPPGEQGREEEGAASRRRGDGTFLGLRDHHEGEDPRRVHWRTSARLGRLVTIERAAHQGGELHIAVVAPEGPSRVEVWERALSAATGAVLEAEQVGRPVRLTLPGRTVRSTGDRYSGVLEALALAALPSEEGP